jgi:hypothetical protein
MTTEHSIKEKRREGKVLRVLRAHSISILRIESE